MIDDIYMNALICEDAKMHQWRKSNGAWKSIRAWKIRKYITGYNRQYQICRNGLVFNKKTDKWLKPQVHSKNGYLYVNLYHGGKSKKVYLHRLIGEYFSPNPYRLNCVFHRDCNKKNNRVSNVWWTSRSLLQSNHDPENPPQIARLPDYRKKGKRVVMTKQEMRLWDIRQNLGMVYWHKHPGWEKEAEYLKGYMQDVKDGIWD
jgi:hypothetical protein